MPGLLLGLITTIVSMVQVGVAAVFEDEIVKPVFVIAPQVRLPLPSLGSATGLLMVLCLVIPVVEIVVGTLGWRRSHGAWDDVCVVIVGVVGLSIISNMLHRADLTHIGFVATFTVARGPCRLGTDRATARPSGAASRRRRGSRGRRRWRSRRSRSPPPRRGTSSGTRLCRPSSGPTPSSSCPTPAVRCPSTATTNSSTTPACYELPTRTPGRARVLFVGPEDLRRTFYSDTFLYFLLPRFTPGSFYLEMDPGVSDTPRIRAGRPDRR